jgi:hypothetical protein
MSSASRNNFLTVIKKGMGFLLLIHSQGEQVTICNSYKRYILALLENFRRLMKYRMQIYHANFTELSCSAPFTL